MVKAASDNKTWCNPARVHKDNFKKTWILNFNTCMHFKKFKQSRGSTKGSETNSPPSPGHKWIRWESAARKEIQPTKPSFHVLSVKKEGIQQWKWKPYATCIFLFYHANILPRPCCSLTKEMLLMCSCAYLLWCINTCIIRILEFLANIYCFDSLHKYAVLCWSFVKQNQCMVLH